jgi:signal transduction histidine kinase
VEQILVNLLSNASKFTPQGGRVTVDCDVTDSRARLTVTDTGPGVPEDKREAIFEPFVQLGRTLTTAHEGTGLGLAISRDLARAMGGDLRYVDQGPGATFVLELPLPSEGER